MIDTGPPPTDRLRSIALSRQRALFEGNFDAASAVAPWITGSWQRCLARGLSPLDPVGFDVVSAQRMRRVQDASQPLLEAAKPAIDRLTQAIAGTNYFAILTDAQGVVVDVQGPVDRSDRRADIIARIGLDLSEAQVGTTAIGAALTELRSVWLHRGEHFFADNSVYSCAGTPLFGPDGQCAGMLDLTGVEVVERPELKHLLRSSARLIENSLLLSLQHRLLMRLNWPGSPMGGERDGLLTLDHEGFIVGSNPAARQMLAMPKHGSASTQRQHASELFATAFETLFDAARSAQTQPMETPLWSGLRVQVLCALANAPRRGTETRATLASAGGGSLKNIESALIMDAVTRAQGNVAKAARQLGISRATMYRKLANKNH